MFDGTFPCGFQRNFFKEYVRKKEESLYQFVFIDKTWIYQNGTEGRSWQNNKKGSVKCTKVNGMR